MACFADINVSQGSVATYAKCGGISDLTHLTASLPRNLPVTKFRLRMNRIVPMSLWLSFWPTLQAHIAHIASPTLQMNNLSWKGVVRVTWPVVEFYTA